MGPFLSPDVLKIASQQSLGDFDANSDGKLSLIEFEGEGEHKEEKPYFTKFDANADGYLDVDEFTKLAMPAEFASHVFDLADKNKDGNLTVQELVECSISESACLDIPAKLFLQNWLAAPR